MKTRKIRIVCISDTHNQTPKLPLGDILIHAGDLTNQGSYSELKKTVEWLEKAPCPAKIVVGGNHDTTLDAPFFHSTSNKWKWPSPQDPVACKALLTSSPHLIYLENSSTTITLSFPEPEPEPDPAHPASICKLNIFGSPYSPGQRGWAFQYPPVPSSPSYSSPLPSHAHTLWSHIPLATDIVITHTPAFGFVDANPDTKDERAGCPVLAKRLAEVKPLMHICGHIHQGRGVGRVRWKERSREEYGGGWEGAGGGRDGGVGDRDSDAIQTEGRGMGIGEDVESVETWTDPGLHNKKLSLLDATSRSKSPLQNTTHSATHSASTLNTGNLIARSESTFTGRKETLMVNAAILGPRVSGKALVLNKPIVIDVDVPVWEEGRGRRM